MGDEALRLDLEERVGEAWGDVDMEGNGILDADEIAQVWRQSLLSTICPLLHKCIAVPLRRAAARFRLVDQRSVVLHRNPGCD